MPLFRRKNLGIITILIAALLPLARWLFLAPLNERFADLLTTLTSLGQITGLIGLALFSINLILSGRLKILDDFFFGLHRVYNYHRQIGALAFSLLLFHPLFLAVRYLNLSVKSAALFFLPGYNGPITFGLIALLLMIILLVLTFYSSLKYQHWKITHKFLVLAFIFALLHSLYIPSDISRDWPLRIYLVVLGISGLTLGMYRSVLSYFLNKNFSYTIKAINRLNPSILEFELTTSGRIMNYQPGQFVFVRFFGGRVPAEIHPFSISSAPGRPGVNLAIKSLGDFTNRLKDLEIGSRVSLEGPYGKFSHEQLGGKNQIWVAGGIGITPFLSMANSLKDDTYKIDLYYCVNNKEEAVFLNELTALANRNRNFRLITWYSAERGYLTGETILINSAGLSNKEILLCGPPAFMMALRKQLVKLAVAKKNIHLENFKFI